jgi:hypothetical protein
MTRINAFLALLAVAASCTLAAPAAGSVSDDVLAEYQIYQRIKQQVDGQHGRKDLHAPERAPHNLQGRASVITALTAANISSYTPYSYYASAGYCEPDTTINWSCGGKC